jgi:acetoin utilization protein AcuB
MARTIPSVADQMTPVPRVIAPHETLEAAATIMQRDSIRHLPVLDGDKLVGIVTERDLRLALGLPGVDVDTLPIERVMTRTPYTVRPEAPIHEVARVMAQRKLGSAIVVEGNKVIGIFTTTDALASLVDLIEGKLERSAFERTALAPVRPKTRHPTREARR